jgi:hypothetical protein
VIDVEGKNYDGPHWFTEFIPAGLVLIRACCACGWQPGPCVTQNGAARQMLRHAEDRRKERKGND